LPPGCRRLPLIYFLVVFPFVVLGVFAWLVSRHSNRLFAPSDFRDESNYARTLTATASLAVASVKSGAAPPQDHLQAVVDAVREAGSRRGESFGRSHQHNAILWVDDRPENNTNERRAFEAMGLSFTLAVSTGDALDALARRQFAAIISDMGRAEGPREGYALLDAIRSKGDRTPLFFYTLSNLPERHQEALDRGAQGSTNDPQILFRMVMRSVLDGPLQQQ
jgi:CheY-like chemotaxis protein